MNYNKKKTMSLIMKAKQKLLKNKVNQFSLSQALKLIDLILALGLISQDQKL